MYKIVNNISVPLTDAEIVKHWTMQFNSLKIEKLEIVKQYILNKPIVPIVITEAVPAVYDGTTLVSPAVEEVIIHVDGARTNKDDFKTNWELMLDGGTTTVKDAYNQFHSGITKAQVEKIWKGIAKNGILVYQKKWTKEAEINAIKIEDYPNVEDAFEALKAIEV